MKGRQGNRLAEDSPRNTYATRDGKWIAISASSQKTFERFAHAIGRPEMVSDPRYQTNAGRCDYADELDETIAKWFLEHDSAEVTALFEKANVVAGAVLDISDIVKNPHYQARENILSVSDVDFGQVRMQGVVPRFGRTPGNVAFAGKTMGADNDEIFGEQLGLSAQDIARLKADKII